MTDTNRFAAAVRGYRDEITAAMQISDESLCESGRGERQRAAVAGGEER